MALLCGSVAPAQAWAWRFDPESGKLEPQEGQLSQSFDSVEALGSGVGVVLLNERDDPISSQTNVELVGEDEAIEGEGALRIGGDVRALFVEFSTATISELDGKRVAISYWQRPEGLRLSGYMYFTNSSQFLGLLVTRPTGRVTSDGWEEWSSGPFDFMFGGAFPPQTVYLYDVYAGDITQDPAVGVNPDRRALVDALAIEIVDEAQVPPSRCTLRNENLVCGALGLCHLGRCVDAALVEGPVIEDEALRNDYLDRRLFEMRAFEGGRLAQALLSEVVAEVEPLRHYPSPVSFWPTYDRAVSRLRDGHASPPVYNYAPTELIGVDICLHLGEADLLPEGGLAPLVFARSGSSPLGSLLAEGDALIAIDDLPVDEWTALAARLLSFAGDPRGYDVTVTPDLLIAAIIGGARVTFARCDHPDGTSCTPEEVEIIDIDLAEMVTDLVWVDRAPAWISDWRSCDYRFRRGVDSRDVQEREFAGFADDGDVRTLLINGVTPTARWLDGVREALNPAPPAMILDQRLGAGGTYEAVDYLTAHLVDPAHYYGCESFPPLAVPLDGELLDSLRQCGGDPGEESCAGYFLIPLGSTGVSATAADIPLAILNTFDVSGNDFTSRILTYRTAPTRTFGPMPTAGAFGGLGYLPSHHEELLGGALQMADSVFLRSADDTELDFQTGVGVSPDQVVFQKQSDAVRGVDTVIEAARAWLDTELEP